MQIMKCSYPFCTVDHQCKNVRLGITYIILLFYLIASAVSFAVRVLIISRIEGLGRHIQRAIHNFPVFRIIPNLLFTIACLLSWYTDEIILSSIYISDQWIQYWRNNFKIELTPLSTYYDFISQKIIEFT